MMAYTGIISSSPQTSLQARILWHKLANETPVSEYLQTKEPEVISLYLNQEYKVYTVQNFKYNN